MAKTDNKGKKEERHIVLTTLFNEKISSVSQAVNAQRTEFIEAQERIVKEFTDLKKLFLAMKEGIEHTFHASISLHTNDNFETTSWHDGFFLRLSGEIFYNDAVQGSSSFDKSTKFGFSIENKFSCDAEDLLKNFRIKAFSENYLFSGVKFTRFHRKDTISEYNEYPKDINFIYDRLEEFIKTAFDQRAFKEAVKGPSSHVFRLGLK